ncbi:MAG TPA: alpha/beta-hydrolase family protein [Devosia sp.]|nr:alpha/beta-hydrolase family protein [Devosia sp.]
MTESTPATPDDPPLPIGIGTARGGVAGWFRRNIPATGLALGAILFALSLTPSLLPRTPLIQGLLSGSVFVVGYAIGAVIEWVWRYLGLKLPGGRIVQTAQWAVAAVCFALVAYCLYRTPDWQNSVRAAMGAPPVTYGHPLVVLLVSLVPIVVFISIGTVFIMSVQMLTRRLMRHAPKRFAFLIGLVIVGILAASLFSGVLLRGALRAADSFFENVDRVAGQFGSDPRPADPNRTGSTASLIAWNSIGKDGREYVQTSPTKADIERLNQRPALEPLRVYVGLRSAQTVDARVDMALAEMKRIGAFDRKVLVVITPAGTGWVDPPSIAAVEYLLDGDVASVALQYSYLISPLSLLVEPDYGIEAAQALFSAVYGYWTTLPKETRPRLYLSGLSLGSHASQSSTQFFDLFADPFNGALWVGPPFTSPIWRMATANRAPDSPEWLPKFGNGSSVRFANRGAQLDTGSDWGPLRIAFLQYPSDPIVFFNMRAWYRAPDWMHDPRGQGVPENFRWYPVVSFFQLAMDMALSNDAPSGYGHIYSPEDYAEAWNAILQPEGWDDAKLAALAGVLALNTGRP